MPYLEAARECRPLSRHQEHALAVRARRGDVAAKQKLARHNLALVVSIALKQYRGHVPLDDLVQEGTLGLLRAVEKFDPYAGTRFTTYAVWWIRAFIGKYLRAARSSVRPKSGTVALNDVSLDAPVSEDGEGSRLDRIEFDAPGPEWSGATAEKERRVRAALASIRKRVGPVGWDIIHMRLQRDRPATLQEIGNRWGLSRERVRQVEVVTKEFLHRYLGGMEFNRDIDRQDSGARSGLDDARVLVDDDATRG